MHKKYQNLFVQNLIYVFLKEKITVKRNMLNEDPKYPAALYYCNDQESQVVEKL